MAGKTKLSRVAAAVGAMLVIACGAALAQGFGGHRGGMGGDGSLFLLAKAAGVDHSKMHAAFKGNANLKSDFQNVKSTHQALITCLASGGSCDSQISNFAAAQQTLTVEKYKLWEGVFKGAPDTAKSTALLGQMQQLEQQRHAVFKQAFGVQSGADASDGPAPSPQTE